MLLTLFLGLAVAHHFRTANQYVNDWEMQKTYYWHLLWRAPGLKSGTNIISPNLPSATLSTYAVGFGLNLLYDSSREVKKVPYWYFSSAIINDRLDTLKADTPLHYEELRNITYDGFISESLVVTRPSNERCLWVVAPYIRQSGELTYDEGKIAAFSNPAQILGQRSATLPVNLIGEEPARDWCYYFEKADLANQQADYLTIIRLWDESQAHHLSPRSPVELYPFLKALLIEGQIDKAHEIIRQTASLSAHTLPAMACDLTQQLAKELPASPQNSAFIISTRVELGCSK
jgi:hypothetical protein